MANRNLRPVHPGAALAEDFLEGLEIGQYRLAKGNRTVLSGWIHRLKDQYASIAIG
jgi:hypothetical protein